MIAGIWDLIGYGISVMMDCEILPYIECDRMSRPNLINFSFEITLFSEAEAMTGWDHDEDTLSYIEEDDNDQVS